MHRSEDCQLLLNPLAEQEHSCWVVPACLVAKQNIKNKGFCQHFLRNKLAVYVAQAHHLACS